jgi:hypothetical protein
MSSQEPRSERTFDLQLSEQEMRTIQQALNEVLHGWGAVASPHEFKVRMRVTREEAWELMRRLRLMSSGQELRQPDWYGKDVPKERPYPPPGHG